MECIEAHTYTDIDKLIADVKSKGTDVLIESVPHDFVPRLLDEAFTIHAQWMDYWLDDIGTIDTEYIKTSDTAAVYEVALSCRYQSHGFTGESVEWFDEWLTDGDILAYYADDVLIGFLCTKVYAHGDENGAIVWIRMVAVRPEYQNRGIARKLIMQAFKYGKDNGAKRSFLHTDRLNITARHLYESIGFYRKFDENDEQLDMLYKTRG